MNKNNNGEPYDKNGERCFSTQIMIIRIASISLV